MLCFALPRHLRRLDVRLVSMVSRLVLIRFKICFGLTTTDLRLVFKNLRLGLALKRLKI